MLKSREGPINLIGFANLQKKFLLSGRQRLKKIQRRRQNRLATHLKCMLALTVGSNTEGRVAVCIGRPLLIALGIKFKPRSVYKYGFFTPMPSGSLHLDASLTHEFEQWGGVNKKLIL